MDKWFKNAADNLEVKPRSEVWNRVEKRVYRPARRPIIRVWPIAAGFLIMLSLSLYLYLDHRVDQNHYAEGRVVITEIDLDAYSADFYNAMEDWMAYQDQHRFRAKLIPMDN